jgi:hypothetical protein
MSRHRLEGEWFRTDTHNVLVFPTGEIGRVDGSVVGHVGYDVAVGQAWKVGEK